MMLWLVLFFAPAAFAATEWWSRAILESLIFLLGAMCAWRRDFDAPLIPPMLSFGGILAIGAVQLLQATPSSAPASVLPFTASRPQTCYALLLWMALAALLWAASGILRWKGALRRLCWAIFGIGFFIAVVGILQAGQGNVAYYGLRPVRHGRPFGPFANCDHAAAWMVASACVGAALFASGLSRGRMPAADRIARQSLILFVLAVVLLGVFDTGSRGGINALFVAALTTAFLAAAAFKRPRIRRLVRASLALGACSYGLFLWLNPHWLGFSNGALDLSAAYRVSMYRSGLRMLADFPAWGIGLGGFMGAFRPYQDPFVAGLVDHVHSSWLEIALESGIPAIMIFGFGVLKPLAALGHRLAGADFPSRALAGGCFAALLAGILHGFVEFSFQIPADAVLFVVLCGVVPILAAPPQAPVIEEERGSRSPLAWFFVALMLVSLPPGFSGYSLRFGGVFLSDSDSIMPVVHPDGKR